MYIPNAGNRVKSSRLIKGRCIRAMMIEQIKMPLEAIMVSFGPRFLFVEKLTVSANRYAQAAIDITANSWPNSGSTIKPITNPPRIPMRIATPKARNNRWVCTSY